MEQVKNQAPTFESVWALMQENAQKWEKHEQLWDKLALDREKFAQERRESEVRFEREMEKSREEYEKRMKRLEETTGAWARNHGSFAEEYFFNAFDNGRQNFFGEHFDKIKKNLTNFWQGVEDEYDIVLYNHTSVALIEVKYKAHESDIPKVLKKAETFKILFPNYKDFKIYLGLASMSFYPDLEQRCIDQGIAVVKQVGDTVVINDAHLKVF